MDESNKKTSKLEIKALRARVGYRLRVLKRSLSIDFASLLLFSLSFILFLVIMLPSIGKRLHESGLLLQPQILQVGGTVFEEIKEPNGNVVTKPLARAVIEIGGFKTISDFNGYYVLEFRALSKRDIPIIFQYKSQLVIARISFVDGEYKKQKDFTFQ